MNKKSQNLIYTPPLISSDIIIQDQNEVKNDIKEEDEQQADKKKTLLKSPMRFSVMIKTNNKKYYTDAMPTYRTSEMQ